MTDPTAALAAALERTGHVGDGHRLTAGIVPEEHTHDDCLFRPGATEDAASLLAALHEQGYTIVRRRRARR